MLCLSLVGVFTMAYNGLGGRLMFKAENSSLYSSSSPSNICSCFKNIIRALWEKPKSQLLPCSQSSDKNYF